MAKARVLVVEGEQNQRVALCAILADEGYEVAGASTSREGLALIPAFAPAAVVAELWTSKGDGITLLQRARALGSDALFLIVSAEASIAQARRATHAGADAFLVKPIAVRAVLAFLEAALDRRRHATPAAGSDGAAGGARDAAAPAGDVADITDIVGDSASLQMTREMVAHAAPTDDPVLVIGEPGTGKHHLARVLHALSQRRAGPFVEVGVGAGYRDGPLPPSALDALLQRAHAGTAFIDDVAALRPDSQDHLLEALRRAHPDGTTRSQGPRFVFGCAHDLGREVEAGQFREDLYFRLDVIAVELPPLRARKQDLAVLSASLLRRHARRFAKIGATPVVTADLLRHLMGHDWPGNIWELDNLLEMAVLLSPGGCITPRDLPPFLDAWPGSAHGASLTA